MTDKPLFEQQTIPATTQAHDPQSDPLLTPRESAAHLNVSKSYLDKLRVYGGGPEFLRPSPRKILYRRSVLDRWVHERRFSSTSEYQR